MKNANIAKGAVQAARILASATHQNNTQLDQATTSTKKLSMAMLVRVRLLPMFFELVIHVARINERTRACQFLC